jgi:hypothetical protein
MQVGDSGDGGCIRDREIAGRNVQAGPHDRMGKPRACLRAGLFSRPPVMQGILLMNQPGWAAGHLVLISVSVPGPLPPRAESRRRKTSADACRSRVLENRPWPGA